MKIEIVLLLVWMHFIADFILQSDNMAKNKSKSNKWLGFHVMVYGIPFLLFGPLYYLVNTAAHFITDFLTSRVSSKLYKENKIHWFFVVIGFDQAMHITTLLLTYIWLAQ